MLSILFLARLFNLIAQPVILDTLNGLLSWVLRHSGWRHSDGSLSIIELVAGAHFKSALVDCSASTDQDFPWIQRSQIPKWREHSQETINMILPVAITI